MISIMNNNDFELDRKPDDLSTGDDSQPKGRDGGGVTSSDDGDGNKGSSFDSIGSEEIRVSVSDKAKSVNGSEEVSVFSENRAPKSDIDGRFLGVNKLEGTGSEKIKVSEDDWKGVYEGMMKSGKVGEDSEEKGLVQVSPKSSDHKIDVWNGGVGYSGKSSVSEYESMISMFDEFATNGKGKKTGGSELSSSVGYGYDVGDMVWGKVKSHPWWPGHIFNETFASPSVRRTKRAGHVLVAFFGDSSYGWFDPAELLPFDRYFSEKSRQTNSRNFEKAVEEAVDEASRRRGMGLACRCRNPYNFRPTNIQGYFSVDVDDYELGGVYSVNQIRKARDDFQARDTLAFMKQLALMPRGDEHGGIGFTKNKATVLAYRKAVFEEFDETYAEAFGQKPVRPTRVPMEAAPQPVRAPLSGPLVFAEALGKRKNSTKTNKAKGLPKKDRYLFKRRDEPDALKTQQLGQTASSMQPDCVEGSTELAAGDYVLQKRAPAVPANQQIPAKLERMVASGMEGASALSRDATSEEVPTIEGKPAVAGFSMPVSLINASKVEPPASFSDSFPVKQAGASTSHLSEPMSSLAKEPAGNNAVMAPPMTDISDLSGKGAFHGRIDDVPHTLGEEGAAAFNSKHDRQSATMSPLVEGFQQPSSFAGQDSKMRTAGAKKAKLIKRPAGELVAGKSVPGEKKKKRKKELGMEMSSDNMQKRVAAGKGGATVGRATGKLVEVGLPPREDFQMEHEKKDDGPSSSSSPDYLGKRQTVGMGNLELKFPQLLGGLQALALNPFHGMETNSPAVIRDAFLKFRSLVFQKSLALSSQSEMEPKEVPALQSPASAAAGSSDPPRENIKDLPPSKPPKSQGRSDDPTKGGRKRGPSDRQEGLAAKRIKKINDMKSLAGEKKAVQKTPEALRDGKEMMAPRPAKTLKADSVKKTESPAKAPEPTMLVMKFPPKTSLPSGSELKARLARFGPLDHSQTRVFWQSYTCRVVFVHRVHAEAAHRHLSGNNAIFGNVNVRCHLRPVGTMAPDSESKETLQLRDSAVEQRPPVAQTPLQQPAVQLKSCLKKPTGDEAGTAATAGSGNGGGGRGTPRVKFMLGGEESNSVGEQLMTPGNKNNYFNNASFADGGASSSSHGMDFNSKNFQKVLPPSSLPPLLPLPSIAQFSNAPINPRYTEQPIAPRNTHNFSTSMAPPPVPVPVPSNIDVAQQMLSLLTKCNDVVNKVSNFLGYVPYHPL